MAEARPAFDALLPSRLTATAARTRFRSAASLTSSPSWTSMARLTFPSRLEYPLVDQGRGGPHRAGLLHHRILRSGVGRRAGMAGPEEVGEGPEDGRARRPAPGLGAVTHGEVGDERRDQGDGEAGIGP